jgi:glycerol uptake facilitator protein
VPSPFFNLIGEVIGTMVLVIVAGAVFSHGVSDNGPAAGVGQWLIASLIWGIGLSLGGTTGYAINPARDLGPRLVHALLPIPGKGSSNWGYAVIPIAGPLLGGGLAGLLLHFAKL